MSAARQMRWLVAAIGLGAAAQAAAVHLFRRQRRRYAGACRHLLVTQGGVQLRLSGEEIGHVVVSVMMGGALLDLRHARPSQRPARMDVLVLMGGVQLLVPEDWNVRLEIETAVGGIRDRRTGSVGADRPPDLVLCGRVVMGGLEMLADTQPESWRAVR